MVRLHYYIKKFLEDDTDINLLNKNIACPKCLGYLRILNNCYYCDNCTVTYRNESDKINFLIKDPTSAMEFLCIF